MSFFKGRFYSTRFFAGKFWNVTTRPMGRDTKNNNGNLLQLIEEEDLIAILLSDMGI